jgi:uncharacterized protein (TIGR03437 family)
MKVLLAVLLLLMASPAGAAGLRMLNGHIPAPVAAGRAARTGRLPAGDMLDVAIGLPLRNRGELETLIQRLSDPASADYRHYLSPQEFTERFGPTEDDYCKVSEFARSNRLTVIATTPNRMLLDVRGTVADLERAFQFTLRTYRDPNGARIFHAPDAEPSVPAGLPILDIIGLDDYAPPRPMNLHVRGVDEVVSNATGSGPNNLFMGKDYRAAYASGIELDGAGQTIGLLEFGPYFPADVTLYKKAAGLPDVPVTNVLLDGVTGLAPPGNDDGEEALDVQIAMSMAPGVSQIIVYQGSNPANIFNRMATDNLARQLSCSWGFLPAPATMDQIFLQFAAQGQTMFVSSGDSGAYISSDRIFAPADNPNITSVGGTSLTTKGAGGPWLGETTWKGSGGGISNTYALPDWQQAISMTANGGSINHRNFPDVAMLADTTMYLIYKNGLNGTVGGTSASAPMWAGYMALINQQAEMNGTPPVGFLNATMANIGAGARYSTDLHDITVGSNVNSKSPNLFLATTGYDLATGWGSPNGQGLIDELSVPVAGAAPSFHLAVAPYGLSVIQGKTADAAVNVAAFNGFSGAVSLSVAGLPNGVTANFSPTTISQTGTLTISASGTAVKGTYPMTIRGTSDGKTQTVGLNLTVIVPDFSISASPLVLTLSQGSSTQANIGIVTTGGFGGDVSLTVSNLPAGVQSSVTPSPTGNLVRLTASGQVSPGRYAVVVSGASGSLRHSVTVGLLIYGGLPAPVPVDLSAWYDYVGISSDGTAAPNSAYSAKLLRTWQLVDGVPFFFGPPDAWNDVSTAGTAISLPAGKFGSLQLLATGEGGAQQSQKFTVRYTDGSSDAFMQSFSDWFNPQNFDGESAGLSFPYRNTAAGSRDNRTFNLYQYSFTLKSAKMVASVTVPSTSGVHVLAMTLVPASFTGLSDYSLSSAAASVAVPQGQSAATVISIAPSGSFQDTVNFTAAGLPTGVTASFSAGSDATSATLNLTAGRSAPPGAATVTITGTGGGIVHSFNLSVSVVEVAANTVGVDLGSAFNVSASYTDGSTFAASGGIDGIGNAYSASLLGGSQVWNGSTFTLGPPNAANGITGQTLKLPAGSFARIDMLATGVQGNQAGQKFVVNYTDGTSSTYTQGLSDWFTPQNYPGESIAVAMPYRVTSGGTKDGRPFNLYGYSFAMSSGKTASSLVLPANASVVVFAVTMVPAAGASGVRITSVVNGATFQAGIAPGAWITITGSNLAGTARSWAEADFVGSTLPSQLDGVSVTIGGYQSAISYISPTQINLQVPVEIPQASAIGLQVNTPRGSASTSVQVSATAPGLFSLDGKYVVGQHTDYNLVAASGRYPGSSPARAGETITLYGTGFGPTDPPMAGRQIPSQAAPMVTLPVFRIGNQAAAVSFAGIVGAGLYQFNVTIPSGLANGDALVVATSAGASTQAGLYLTIQ